MASMLSLLFSLVCALLVENSNSQFSAESAEVYQTIQFRDNLLGDVQRQYYFNIPTIEHLANPVGKRALLVAFHGLTNDCDSFREYSGYREFSDEAGVYLATPCAKAGYLGQAAWNAGRCCVNFNKHDDVQFFDEVVKSARDYISGAGLPPFQEIWVAGFSNGGFLTEAIACQRRHVINKFVSIAGNTILGSGNDGAFDMCDALWNASPQSFVDSPGSTIEDLMDDTFNGDASSPRSSLPDSSGLSNLVGSFPSSPSGELVIASLGKSVSSLHIHCTGDLVVPFNGDYLIRRFPSKQKDVARWAERVGCSSTYTSSDVAQSWVLRQYCEAGSPLKVNLLIQNGGSHGMERLYGQHSLAFFTGDARFLDEGHSQLK